MRGVAGVLLGCVAVGCAPASPTPESTPEPTSLQQPVGAPELAAAPATTPAPDEPKREKLSEIGAKAPALGDVAPPFELPDQTGKLVALATVLESGPAVLVFYRGDW